MFKYEVCLVSFLRRFKRVILLPGYASSDIVLMQIIGMLPEKLRKLPVFLRGPAAAYFHSLADAPKDTYVHLI